MEKVVHIIFDVIIGFIIKLIAFVMISSVLLQIAFRYLPITGTTWTEELGRLTFLWFCMLSTAVTFVKGQHLFIDFFYLKFPKIARIVCDYVSLLLVLGFSTLVTVNGIRLLEFVGKQHSPVMRLSILWFYLSVPVGCGLIMLFTILSLIDLIFLKGKIGSAVSANDESVQAVD
jgi:TRAP-type C4-dicarboxylate transport system permease small subunit